ncbi:putative hydrolase [Streptomyces lincolnensis]|uniref:Putative hydrolase n=1 Tax=Streptomyces lincolnensis TaxID=1915 RepID=A0A1B1MP79_STRLN|nr:isochorismatase family protein [Streptomyces lincolnensis]ANS70421.1 putative hydrolase [Streptomyces lincolnensis]
MSTPPQSGPDALPTPAQSVLLLIDHQPLPYLYSHRPTTVFGNVLSLAKAAEACRVPTVLTTSTEEHSGPLLQPLQVLFPDRGPITRTVTDPWQDRRVVDAVQATGRKNLVIAGLYTETCVTLSALHAADEGYAVHVVTDACAGVTAEAHELAVRRMALAGVVPVTRAAVGTRWAPHRTRNQQLLATLVPEAGA